MYNSIQFGSLRGAIVFRILLWFIPWFWVPLALSSDFSTTNVQYLYGTNYADGLDDGLAAPIDKEERAVLTIENALRWRYGDVFFFVDIEEPDSEGTKFHAELQPRFSLGQIISGRPWQAGIVKDVFVATQIESGNGLRVYLYGAGLSLDIPYFSFFNLNMYARETRRDFVAEDTDTGGQITIAWKLPFTISSMDLVFEGFADYTFSENGGSNPREANLLAAPRLLLDIGNFWDKPGVIQAGIEYQIWRNKFGINGVDEDVVQAMIKWII